MKLISTIRLFLSMLFKGPNYNIDLLRITNKRFCNNSDKIIGWYKGHPSFFLYSPPVFSRPSANALTTKIMSIYQWRKLPEIMSLAVTDKCNCICEYCSFTSMKKNEQKLSTAEIIDAVKQAQDLGVATISIVGGEPLLNNDIIKIINSINKNLSQVIMFTNGFHLKDKVKELKKAGLTTIIVSIDSFDEIIHDNLKGTTGLFKKAVKGINEARKHGLLVGLSSVAYKKDMQNGNLIKLFDLAKKLKVNEIILFDSMPTGNYTNREDICWSDDDIKELIKLCETYHNKKNYPGIFPYSYLKSSRGMGCSGGVHYFYLSPYGDICPCDFNSFSVGNIKNEPLYSLWDKFNEKNDFCKSNLGGCRTHDKIIKRIK